MVAVLTNIERRFEIPSSKSGLLLSLYDIGHTCSVLLVGHFFSRSNKPKWTAAGLYDSSDLYTSLELINISVEDRGFMEDRNITW